MLDSNLVALVSLVVVLAGLGLKELKRYVDYRVKLSAIPTYGNDGLFSSYSSALEFVKHGTKVVQEGYKKVRTVSSAALTCNGLELTVDTAQYPNQAFKIAMLDRYLVVITGKEMIEDLRKSGDEDLSISEAFKQAFQTDYMVKKSNNENPHHIQAIQGSLTRHLSSKFGEVYDELSQAFNDEIPLTDDWVKVPTLQKALNIVSRTSNRLFVGLPLCRNKEWLSLNIRYTIDFFVAVAKFSLFPKFLHPLVAWYTSPYKRSIKTALEIVEPLVRERVDKFKAGSEDLEDDMLTWIIQSAPKDDSDRWLTPEELGSRLLSMNFVSIHTTEVSRSLQAFTHGLINLASHPEYIEPLCREIEACIEKDGWSKAAMGKMRMLDSFLKESQRVSSSAAVSIRRLALRDFVFSNGTVIPAGTMIAISPSALHFDEDQYSNPFEFDGFRSYKQREEEWESIKHQMVTPQTNYVAFGVGKHACPGRFFAVNEIKALVSHTLMYYDLKLDESEAAPKTEEFGGRIFTNSKTGVMFRKRQGKA
ncbi:hypothetical protein AAF712_015832 [Marasmius tenuissimus]|uniref:Cytochrome P450 n=1 Tax=Marasmius tenuissimus TaxID=585030 RepID=A0ABR2Z8G3_9AGAR